jgi:hypothetical protein
MVEIFLLSLQQLPYAIAMLSVFSTGVDSNSVDGKIAILIRDGAADSH